MSNRGRGSGNLLQFLAFLAVMILALALAASLVLFWIPGVSVVAQWVQRIIIGLVLIVPMFVSYPEARRRGTVWFVLWIIAIILIVVFYIVLTALSPPVPNHRH